MCSVVAALLILLAGFFGYSIAENQVAPLQQTEAEPIPCAVASSQDDVSSAFAIAGDTFEPNLWTVELPDDEYTEVTTVYWQSSRFSSIAHLDYVQYDCGVTQTDLDLYLRSPNFQNLFALWGAHEKTAQCARNGVSLVEFDVLTTYGADYHALYWVKQLTPTRVATLNLVFPVELETKQTYYARRLFPELPDCER